MNGQKTMVRRDGSDKELGQPVDGTFTEEDLFKLRTLYKCGNTETTKPTTQRPTTQRPTTQQPTTESGSCEDKYDSYCVRYSTRYCNRGGYMRNCPKTCGACQGTCEDLNSNLCNYYSRYCRYSQPGDYLDINCR